MSRLMLLFFLLFFLLFSSFFRFSHLFSPLRLLVLHVTYFHFLFVLHFHHLYIILTLLSVYFEPVVDVVVVVVAAADAKIMLNNHDGNWGGDNG